MLQTGQYSAQAQNSALSGSAWRQRQLPGWAAPGEGHGAGGSGGVWRSAAMERHLGRTHTHSYRRKAHTLYLMAVLGRLSSPLLSLHNGPFVN